ncbi:hypothetical protein [Pseudothauera lacus]|nr:hypothetical protein [Pseudothauera lacus]
MRKGLAGQRLAGVFLGGMLLFNYPLLSLFDVATLTLGFPLLYIYVFAVWAAMIALIAWIVERGSR